MSLFRVLKVWQNKASYIYQSQLSPAGQKKFPSFKKFYVLISASPNNYGVSLSLEKPATSEPNTLSTVHRKHQKSGGVVGIFKHKDHRDYKLEFYSEHKHSVTIFYRKPPEIHFSNEQESLCRETTKSTYTKRRPVDEEILKTDLWLDITEDLLSKLEQKSLAADDSEANPEEENTTETARSALYKSLKSKIKRRLKTLNKTLKKAEDQLEETKAIDLTENKARLLQTYSYLVKEDDYELKLTEEQTSSQALTIELDPDISTGENIEAYFKTLKRLKRKKELVSVEHKKILAGIKTHQDALVELDSSADHDNLILALASRLKLTIDTDTASKKHKEAERLAYKSYLSSEGFNLRVGRSSIDNDSLTKSAAANDIWVHVVQGSGSHVIIVKRSTKSKMSDKTIKEAAILAIHESPMRRDMAAEVYVAEKKDIKKKKGMPAGLWSVLKSENRYVRYSKEELEKVLASKT